MKAPKLGFSDRDLTNYFGRIYTPQSRTPTRALPTATSAPTTSPTSGPKKSEIGAIAGGAAGGAVFLLAIIALLVWLYMKQRRRSATAAPANGQQDHDQQNHLYQHNALQASENMQKRSPIQGGELPAESVHEMPGRTFSPVTSKSGLNYQVQPLSSTTPSSTHSPYSSPHSPQSPPMPTHSPTYSYQGQNSAQSPSYAVIPPYQPQTFNQQPGQLFPMQQEAYSPTQPIFAQPVPQQHYVPQPHVCYPPPPQDNGLYTQGPEVRRPSNPGSATNVRIWEVGSVSSGPGYSHEQEGM